MTEVQTLCAILGTTFSLMGAGTVAFCGWLIKDTLDTRIADRKRVGIDARIAKEKHDAHYARYQARVAEMVALKAQKIEDAITEAKAAYAGNDAKYAILVATRDGVHERRMAVMSRYYAHIFTLSPTVQASRAAKYALIIETLDARYNELCAAIWSHWENHGEASEAYAQARQDLSNFEHSKYVFPFTGLTEGEMAGVKAQVDREMESWVPQSLKTLVAVEEELEVPFVGLYETLEAQLATQVVAEAELTEEVGAELDIELAEVEAKAEVSAQSMSIEREWAAKGWVGCAHTIGAVNGVATLPLFRKG